MSSSNTVGSAQSATTIGGSAAPPSLYVATTGHDSNPGTWSAPLRTISAAATRARPGTEVLVRGGIYAEAPVTLAASGSSSAYIHVHPHRDEAVTISSPALSRTADAVAITGSYVELSGFRITGGKHGIVAWNAHNVHILRNVVDGAWSSGILLGGDTPGAEYGDNIVRDNTVTNNVMQNKCLGCTAWGSGIISIMSDGNMIEGNTVSRNYGEGIDIYSSNRNSVIGNHVFDNFSCEIYIDSSSDSVVSRNFTYSSGNSGFFVKRLLDFRPAIGIAIATEPGAPIVLDVRNTQVTNNVDVGSGHGLRWWNEGSSGSLSNSLIANNTFVNEIGPAVEIDAYPGNADNRIANNIFYKQSDDALAAGSVRGNSFDHNAWFGRLPSRFHGPGDVLADPLLVGPLGRFELQNYKISNTSPVRTAGAAIEPVTTDLWNARRTIPYSIGASENDN